MFSIRIPLALEGYEEHRAIVERAISPSESDIVRVLYSTCSVGQQDRWSTTQWTREIKTRLRALGQERGYLVFPRWNGRTFVEQWLFDLIWAVW